MVIIMYVWSGILHRNIWYATMQKINVGFRSQSRRCYNVKTRCCYNVKKRFCYVGLWRLKNFHFQLISNVYPTSVSDIVSTSIQRQLFAGLYGWLELIETMSQDLISDIIQTFRIIKWSKVIIHYNK